jgi:peptide/nickel transport system substrate-binding protein
MSDLSTVGSGTNYTNWADPEFFGSWKDLDATRDLAQQEAIINRMMQIFHERGPWLALYCQPDIYGVSNKIAWKPRADEVIAVD